MSLRMIGLWVARAAKVLALLAFFLPWVVVSCNGDPLVQSTGYQMATGTIELPKLAVTPEGQGQAWWALGAMIVIALGLVAGFLVKPLKRAAMVMLLTSIVSLGLVFGGMTQMVSAMRAEIVQKLEENSDSDNDLERQFARLLGQAANVEVKVQEGYWLELMALLAAIAGSGVAAVRMRNDPEGDTDMELKR